MTAGAHDGQLEHNQKGVLKPAGDLRKRDNGDS